MIHQRRTHFIALTLLAVLCCISRHGHANDQFDLNVEQLFNATVISGSKTPQKLWDTAAAIYVLNTDDIRNSGATSIPEVLRQVPGVHAVRTNASGWAVSIRGFNSALSNKLLVLIDGREVYDPLFSGVYWDIQDVPLEDIERIEVIRGPGASLWGANAVNGVINIITKNAADTQGVLVTAGGGLQPHAFTTLRYGGKAGNETSYRVYGKYIDRADGDAFIGGNANDGQEHSRTGFRSDWNGGADSITVMGNAYHNNDGQLRNVPFLVPPYVSLQEENIFAYGGNLLARWNREMGDNSRLSLQGYVNYSSREQQYLTDRRITFDLDGQYEFAQIDRHKFIMGGRFRSSGDRLNSTDHIMFANENRTDLTFSGFIQDKITLEPEKWFLTLGSKFENNDYSGFEAQPDVRLSWNIDDAHFAWLSFSRAVRIPSRLEHDAGIFLSSAGPSSLFPLPIKVEVLPSPEFYSEELLAYQFGYRQHFTPKLVLDFTSFLNNYRSLATFSSQGFGLGANPLHVTLPVSFSNKAAMDTYGFEAVMNWQALEKLKLTASYSLLETDLHAPTGVLTITGENQAPQQQFNLHSHWDAANDLAFDAIVYYADALQGYTIPSFWNLDIRAGWQVTDQLQFDLVGQNLIEETHREFGNDAAAAYIPRSFYGKFTWRY